MIVRPGSGGGAGRVQPCVLVRMPSSIKGPKVKVLVTGEPNDSEEDAIHYSAEKVESVNR